MPTYLANATVFDGERVRRRTGVLVAGSAIEWVGPHARAPRAARAATAVDASSLTITPGLIDAHVHLSFDGGPDFAAEAREMTSDAVAAVKAVRNAARTVERGVTTVRDLGAPGDSVIQVARAVAAGRLPGPTILAAGRALTITGGHGHNVAFAREVDGPDEVRRAVRQEIRAGATAIKVIATGGVLTPGISHDFTAFTPEELAAAVDEASRWGRLVAAHGHGAAGIEQAVRAGVRSVEHGSMITAPIARLMKERGTFHVPTISAIHGILEHPDEVPTYALEKGRALAEVAREAFGRSMRAGVPIACGTDAGTPFNPHGGTPLEVGRMVGWGMTPLAALRAATRGGARLLGLSDRGRIAAGAAADLVLYAEDPTERIDALQTPLTVFRDGEVVAGREV